MLEKIEVIRGQNGFAVVIGRPGTTEMLVFSTWDETIKYLSNQGGLWGKMRTMEAIPSWVDAPEWATHWENKAQWVGEGQTRSTLVYSESRPEDE